MTCALGLTDGSAGMIAQVRALAEALGLSLEERVIAVAWPWRYLPNIFFDLGVSRLFPVSAPPSPAPLPEIVISCGRKAALVAASWAQHARSSGIRFIHIQDPQMSPSHFNLVMAMQHDRVRGENVIRLPYALHSITEEKLAAARAQWEPRFAHLPRPWNAVLIGGSTNKYHFTPRALADCIRHIDGLAGSLLITTSRRTGAHNAAQLTKHFAAQPHRCWLYTGEGDNPYLGLLACADHVYVTNDSVNMMTEAKASGKPVTILNLRGHVNTKPARFAQQMDSLSTTPTAMMEALARALNDIL